LNSVLKTPTPHRTLLFRAPLFDTCGKDSLRVEEDGGLLIRDGRIVARGPFAVVRQQAPDAPVEDWRGGVVLPGLVDTHVHFPQLRIIGGLGRTLLDWLEHVALPEEARMADLAYAQDTARQFVRALAAAAAGLRIASGLVLSDRHLRAELHQSVDDAYRT
jgi:guanine deaminase